MKVFKAHPHAFGQADNGPAFIFFLLFFASSLLFFISISETHAAGQTDGQTDRQTGQRRESIKKRMSNSALDVVTVQIHFVQELYTTILRDTVLHYGNRDYERHTHAIGPQCLISYTCFAFVHSLNVCISYVLSQDRILNPLVYKYPGEEDGRLVAIG
ncbi:hypothetical protein GE21DRAFT_4111 [Neurospora crassa]|uniref:Uncharacterized protein n=1 Tax=Neurospora crassa (strain ATCC 24698 / 74-OR23-1A / CBS 708.71 / DSM 1257 / FGSC 987) TaxID=367110 RepID=U9W2Z4_NEUCR|nr:hypothetical protein NCU16634 [Neurospora crassa OR74A]ESA43177.1 hypothetical protein NCU16634 [Neurospora crassa OR74A]KHE85482.1 hypothetical protein GE21DRAFT_4111 [Neurospora crassa]|eukprot:XP_011394027.1 hypothetical protein NCU16634 [Neurospora crassa OR74A]